jgi:hypothetical protein
MTDFSPVCSKIEDLQRLGTLYILCLQPDQQRGGLRLEGGGEVPEEEVRVEEFVDGDEAGVADHIRGLG